ncbi:terminase large subunit domain-containing protein [Azospirillum aestuarii]|uniref:terminase large subunit domain-containing protein n=1 Tax=Azospirillum aestuarii TaxID=2802052 RepID=UPI004055067B
MELAERYIDGVLSGAIPACKWVKLACQRHRDDLKADNSADWPYRFDPAKAEKVCKFIELLPHTKGKWRKRDPLNPTAHLLRLEPWQCFIVCMVFGWVRKSDGFRRFRQVYVEVPRKNGKSALVAAIGIYMLCADGEEGAEVYAGATTEKQAWEVFGPAREMLINRPDVKDRAGISVNARNISIIAKAAKFEPVIGKPGDGASPSASITDEFHEHATSEQFDTMVTGMRSRRPKPAGRRPARSPRRGRCPESGHGKAERVGSARRPADRHAGPGRLRGQQGRCPTAAGAPPHQRAPGHVLRLSAAQAAGAPLIFALRNA